MTLHRELAKVFNSRRTILATRILKFNEVSKEYPLSSNFYFSSPFGVRLVPNYSLLPRSIVRLILRVGVILRMGAWTKIVVAIIKAITVTMVHVRKFGWAYLPMHIDQRLTLSPAITNGIISLSAGEIVRAPIPLIKPFVIARIDNRDLTFSKRDVSDRLILRLDNRLAEDAAFGHGLTSNEIAAVQPHHYFTARKAA